MRIVASRATSCHRQSKHTQPETAVLELGFGHGHWTAVHLRLLARSAFVTKQLLSRGTRYVDNTPGRRKMCPAIVDCV